MRGRLGDRQRWTVPLSLAVSFLANDGEEFLTLVPTWPDVLDRLPVDVSVPSWVRDVDQCHVNVGIAMMGALCAAAVADGCAAAGGVRSIRTSSGYSGCTGSGTSQPRWCSEGTRRAWRVRRSS